jgi:hypothetical protein
MKIHNSIGPIAIWRKLYTQGLCKIENARQPTVNYDKQPKIQIDDHRRVHHVYPFVREKLRLGKDREDVCFRLSLPIRVT